MPRTRKLMVLIVLAIMLMILAACGGAPAPQSSGAATAPAASRGAPTAEPAPTAAVAPTAGAAATAAPAPTAAAATTAPAPTNEPLVDTNPAKPNDATQARLRVSNCVMGGPSVDVLVNGKVAVNGGMPQANLGALDASGYLYLAPATYSVALVPTGEGIDKALLGPLDVPIVAGHRYTVVMLGQADEPGRTPLVIDETEAYQKAGVSPSTQGQITINNIKGAAKLSFVQDEVGTKDVLYRQFAAAAMPAGPFKDFRILVGDETIENNGAGISVPGVDQLDCFGGTHPGPHDTHTTQYVSTLPLLDYLQLQSDFSAKNGGQTWAYATFLAALKTAGLTDMLATGGPYLLLAPRDEAFAALPKDKLNALLADPKALAEVLRGHIVEGYFPSGTMSSAPGVSGFNRTVTNMRGEQLTLTGNDEGLSIKGMMTGPTQPVFVANGTRVMSVGKLLLPATQATAAPPAQASATAQSIPSSSAELTFKGHTGRVVQASFSPDGKTVLTGSEDQTARLWDVATGKELRQFVGHADQLRGAIFSPDGKTIFTTSNDQTARLWDVATGKELRQFIGHTDTVNKAAFSPDGKYVVTASPDGTARVWDVSTAKSLLTFTGHAPSSPNRPAFAPDGKAIVTGGLDGTVLMWEPLTGTILKTFKGHTGPVGTPAFSPDGKYLVTPSDDGTARLWDVASVKELRRFEVPGVVIAGAAFSPDGKYLATSGFDGIARLWDAQTGKELRQFVGHTDEVRTVAFSPDGNYILTASNDGTARLWRIG